jgi:superfamily I DNA and/or RNA helicase
MRTGITKFPWRKTLRHKVDKIQGNEANVGIFAYTRTNEHGFLGQSKRLCVACSRAESALYIWNEARFSD